MTELTLRPAVDLLEALERGSVSSRELLEAFLARVSGVGSGLNAVVTLDADRARQRADAADAARARGESWGALHGLPMTLKDTFETAGLRTTAGAKPLSEHVPDTNAVAVQRLLDAGAIVFGKTNTPAWAMDWQSYNEIFGTSRNPWDTERTPGGSSGGAAAAVAAGLTSLELGSDIGGSIRIPAHCCGVFGHKPSWGIVPQRGHIPGLPGSLVETDINVVGPIARSVDDLRLALGVIAGPQLPQAKAWKLELPPARRKRAADWRVAVWLDDPHFPTDAAVLERLEAAVEALRSAGVQIDTTTRPPIDLPRAVDLYRRLLAPATAASLEEEQFEALVAGAEGSTSTDDLVEFSRAVVMRHREWVQLHDERERMRRAWEDFFQDVDLLLCPVASVPAIPHDHSEPFALRTIQVNGAPRPYLDHFTWMGPIGASLLPATSVPVGRTPEGLPVGAQIVAPYLEDHSALGFAKLLASEMGGFTPPPGFDGPGGLG